MNASQQSEPRTECCNQPDPTGTRCSSPSKLLYEEPTLPLTRPLLASLLREIPTMECDTTSLSSTETMPKQCGNDTLEEPDKEVQLAPDLEEIKNKHCPVCHEPLIEESCKLVCRSEWCRYLVVVNCSDS